MLIQLDYPNHYQEVVPCVLALGFFDGVHRGHQAVIKQARALANQHQLPLAVLTFNNDPRSVHRSGHDAQVKLLSSVDRKVELLEALGVNRIYFVEYTPAFAQQGDQAFVDDYLVGLAAQYVVAGFDYSYGPPTRANMQTLPNHAKGRFQVVEVPAQILQDEKISSTSIRRALAASQLDSANAQLGYNYQTQGRVVSGKQRGRLIGYPTANVQVDPELQYPGIGVYVVRIRVEGRWHWGMASIGYNITFGDLDQIAVEVNILDFQQDIYGAEVAVEWCQYLRDELKFDDVESLISQLQIDEQSTRLYIEDKER